MTSGLAPGEIFPVGTTEVQYEATDGVGNTTICVFTVTIIDHEAPEIICPADIIQEDPIVNYQLPEVIENCTATLTMFEGLEPGEVFPHGYTTVTYIATDAAGLADTCSFTILINTPPVAVTDSVLFAENDDHIVIDIMGNDYDLDGDSIFVTGIVGGMGEVTLNEDGTLTYDVNTSEWCGVDSIMYTLCDEYNACDTAYVYITVECFLFVIIPEGISPNGDGINDAFEIVGINDYPGNHLAIFNRWGHKVFEASDYDNSWQGTSDSPVTIGNGMLPKGTYFYVLDLKDGHKPIKGYFFLNR